MGFLLLEYNLRRFLQAIHPFLNKFRENQTLILQDEVCMRNYLSKGQPSGNRTLRLLLLCLLFCTHFVPTHISAQNLSEKSRFSATQIIGCAPLTVDLTNLVNFTNNDVILYNFNGTRTNPILLPFNTPQVTDTTYQGAGTYLIVQVNGNAPAGDEFDFLEIVVVDPSPPSFTVETCSENSINITLDFAADDYDEYFIEFGDGNTQTVDKSGTNVIPHQYAAQNNYSIIVSGRLTLGEDATCGSTTQTITTFQDLPPPAISFMKVEDVQSVRIEYDALDLNSLYRLEMDDGSGFAAVSTIDPTSNQTSFTYSEASLDFVNSSYTFRMVTYESCSPRTATSNEIQSVGLSGTAIYNGPQIDLTLNWLTDVQNLNDVQIIESVTTINSATDASGSFLVVLNNCTETLTYVARADVNGVISESIDFTPNLSGTLTPDAPSGLDAQFSDGNIVITMETPEVTTASYSFLRQNENGDFMEVGTASIPRFVDTNVTTSGSQVCYQVRYLDACGNVSVSSEVLCVTLSGRVLLPNAFSPDGRGDPDNEVFRVSPGVYRNFEFYIYNRWGQLVYQSTDSAEGWNGQFNSGPAPIGTYVYRLSYSDLSNLTITQTGTFILIR